MAGQKSIPTIEQAIEFGLSIGLSETESKKFWHHHNARGWILANKQKMRRWRSAMWTWMFNLPKYGPPSQAAAVAKIKDVP
jgi:hypothetical protein